jgi:integrase
MRIELTQAFISKGLHCPDGRQKIEYTDAGPGGVPGLFVEVRAGSPGRGSYFLRYKNAQSRTCYQRLGTSADLTLAAARKTARELRARIVLGADPRAEATARKEVITLERFWTEHYLPHAMQSKRSWRRDEQLFRLRIKPVFGHKRLTEISRQQIEAFHTRLAEEGLAPASCDLHLKLVRTLMGRAELYGHIKESPARRLRLFNPDNRVEHFLTPQQLDLLLATLRSDSNRPVCQIVMFMLATAVRLQEALKARWVDIDRERRVFTIRATVAKGKKSRYVPLSDAAMQVVDGLHTEGKHEYLFVNKRTDEPYTTIAKQWLRIRASAGLNFLRAHDLRHNLAALMANNGRTLLEIQNVLGHADPRMSLRYIRLTKTTLLDAANSTSPALMRESDSADPNCGPTAVNASARLQGKT